METKGISSELFNGSTFRSIEVKNILERAYRSNERLRLFYGSDGKTWQEEHDIIGTVGRSTGVKKIALLVYSSTSSKGTAILTDKIIGIYSTTSKKCLYWNKNYNIPKAEVVPIVNDDLKNKGYFFSVLLDDELYSNHKTEIEAIKLSRFMTGKRFSK